MERHISPSAHGADQSIETVLAALEEIDLGIILLDHGLQVKFVNSAFVRLYRLPDKSMVSNCDFESLMRIVVVRRRVLPRSVLNSYVKGRVKEVRAGIEGTRDIQWMTVKSFASTARHYPREVVCLFTPM